MRARTRNPFLTVRTEGSILPADILARIVAGDKDLGGLTPECYHLAKNERINEVVTRAWNRLQGAWQAFREASERLPELDLGTTLTRERWLLILFQELGYGRLMTHRAWELDGRTYPISHLWDQTPIHLVGCRVGVDKRQAGVAGAARVSPHSLVQEFLNRSEDHLWGIVSNGLTLRLLRDNVSLTRQAFVEFDLEAMMESEAFSDFVLLFMICHQSRVEVPEEKTPENCWLEQWHNAAAEQGIRALDTLRAGVQQAINALGAGFLAHPANTELRGKLKDGVLSTQDYYRQILRVVYRLLFLFVAEDRDLLYDPASPLPNRKTYVDYYSTKRIRDLAQRRRGTKHADLYRGLRLVFEKLREGCPELALPALGSFLFSGEATPDLDRIELANRDLLEAIRKLACTVEGNALRPIDYRNLGPEELGSVYESLLEMHPRVNTDAAAFALEVATGSERKTTGSYYTHSSLVQCLLDSALDPVLDEAAKKPDPETALLNLKICDPASGSGHFLIAAAHRVAKRLAAVRTGEDEPPPDATRSALRDVIGRCIYGVDINPMAVELCKISLWMEAMEPGKALGFLDHHIKCGNSLLGTTPALMAGGIPDDVFKPIEGDDKVVCKDLKKQNKRERSGQDMFGAVLEHHPPASLTTTFAQLSDEDDSSAAARARKANHYRTLVQSTEYENAWFLADAWCAAFVLPKTNLDGLEVTHRRFRNWEGDPGGVSQGDRKEIRQIAGEYQFFHWHPVFPEVFRVPAEGEKPENEQCGWSGGFDCVLGNPPWEHIELQNREWFASRAPEIAGAKTAAERERRITALRQENPDLLSEYLREVRFIQGQNALLRNGGGYPLCAVGRINTYAVFAELSRTILSRKGSVGCIVPTGIATGDVTKQFFADLLATSSLASLLSFENEEHIFPGVHNQTKFCLLTMNGIDRPVEETDLFFFARQAVELSEKGRHFTLSATDFSLLNPNTQTCPTFRWKCDAELSKFIYRRVPILRKDSSRAQTDQNPWLVQLRQGLFNMASDSSRFRDQSDLSGSSMQLDGSTFCQDQTRFLPLYEGKMIHNFDHRYGTYDGQTQAQANKGVLPQVAEEDHSNPLHMALPRYWVNEIEVKERVPHEWLKDWFLGWRAVCRSVDHRTLISTIVPRYAAGDTLLLAMPKITPSASAACLAANMACFVADYCARQKAGGSTLKFYVMKQLPFLPPDAYESSCIWHTSSCTSTWIVRHALELLFTAWDLSPFGVDCGYNGPPFVWEEERRFLIRSELDAAFFHLYLGTSQEWSTQGSTELLDHFQSPREAVDYIMETFPIVRRKDEAQYGEYRTKLQILDIYDAMQHAIDTGEPYQTLLDPPPGPPADEHGNFLPLPEWKRDHSKPHNWPSHIHPPKEVAEYNAC